MNEQGFVMTADWLTRLTRVTRDMVRKLAPEEWPEGRRSPHAGWKDRLMGRTIPLSVKADLEASARALAWYSVQWHEQWLAEARDRLAAFDEALAAFDEANPPSRPVEAQSPVASPVATVVVPPVPARSLVGQLVTVEPRMVM